MDLGEDRQLVSAGFARQIHISPPIDIVRYLSEWIAVMDEWDTTKCHPKIVISREDLLDAKGRPFVENAHCIERVDLGYTHWYHSYGKEVVEKGQKQQWTFQFRSCKDEASVSIIGIIDEEHIDPLLDNFCLKEEYGGYGLETWNNTFVHSSKMFISSAMGTSWFCEHAVLRMELDMTSKEGEPVLSFCMCNRNGVIQNKVVWDEAHIDADRRYRLCVSLYHNKSKIALIPSVLS